MPIVYIDYSPGTTVADVIKMFHDEMGVSIYIVSGTLVADLSTPVLCLQRAYSESIPLSTALKSYRGVCLINIDNEIQAIEEKFFERYLLHIKIYLGNKCLPSPRKLIRTIIEKDHPSKYRMSDGIHMLQNRFDRIYTEAWQKVNDIDESLKSLKAAKKESDSLVISASVIYRVNDMNDEIIPDDVYTQHITFDMEGKIITDKPIGHQESVDNMATTLLSTGMTVYDILRLNYRIVISIDWGSCRKSLSNGYGIEY